jgi:hypothetical protein
MGGWCVVLGSDFESLQSLLLAAGRMKCDAAQLTCVATAVWAAPRLWRSTISESLDLVVVPTNARYTWVAEQRHQRERRPSECACARHLTSWPDAATRTVCFLRLFEQPCFRLCTLRRKNSQAPAHTQTHIAAAQTLALRQSVSPSEKHACSGKRETH